MHTKSTALGVFLLLIPAGWVAADVDLVTLPTRDGVQLTIYNSDDITMVREQRLLTVKPGINRIQFSWANTLIDPTSIDFRILDKQDQVDLIDTPFPAGRTDALQWNVRSRIADKIPVEIRYFTSGITWSADYVGVANQDETRLNLTGYIRVTNNSGELYDNTEVRLVVGNINLVEKIAELATRPAAGAWRKLKENQRDQYLFRFGQQVEQAEDLSGRLAERWNSDTPERTKQVVKQGLSEYFLFAIEGREDIKNEEPKRLVALQAAEIPLECVYKLTDREGGEQFAKYYRFKNLKLLNDDGTEKELPTMENLGLSPLPNGTVRLLSEYANQDLAYVGGTETKYVPIGDRVEVNVGPAPDITMTRRLKDRQVANILARQQKRRLDDEFVLYYDLVDFDETLTYEEEIVSGKAVQAKTEVERRFDANVVLWSGPEPPADWNSGQAGAYVDLHQVPGRVERVDENHVKYFLDLKPGEKQTVRYRVTYKRRQVGPELNAEKRREPL